MLSSKTNFRKVKSFKIDFWSADLVLVLKQDGHISILISVCFCMFWQPYMLCFQDSYYRSWEIGPGFPSSAHSFLSSDGGTQKTTRAESLLNTSLVSPRSMHREQNSTLSWDGCTVGTAMSGPMITAWQGHNRMRYRGNRCCKLCKAAFHFVNDAQSFCACVQCPGASTDLQTSLALVKLGKSWEEPPAIAYEMFILTAESQDCSSWYLHWLL